VQTTPFEAVVYSSLQACAQAYDHISESQKPAESAQASQQDPASTLEGGIPSSISADFHFRAEYKLLTDFLVSVPKIKQQKVSQFIKNAEMPS